MDSWIVTEQSRLNVMKNIASQPGQDDPFYILDVADLVRKVDVWQQLMPRVEIFYAVKCNDNGTVLETLVALGTGFDCASKNEIQTILNLGVEPSRIIFAHPCKAVSDITFASRKKISCMTFDSQEELQKVKIYHPDSELVLRICCNALSATYTLGKKYGARLEDSASLLKRAKELDLHVVGVSFHVGSGCQEINVFQRAIAAARQVFDEGAKLGMNLHLLDIGGGFPGKTSEGLEGFASVINSALDRYFPDVGDHLKIIAEPGRYIVTSAFSLATSIRAKKASMDNRKTTMYYINDGLFGSFSTNIFEEEPFIPKVLLINRRNEKEEEDDREVEDSIVWGPTCSALDVLKKNIRLPRLECDDWLYWSDMGAYTLSNVSFFNGFPKPSVHAMASSDVMQCLKQRESSRC